MLERAAELSHDRIDARRLKRRGNVANPLLIEPLLNDPSLRKTNFVMIHGGWPYTREITPLLTKPNAYVDFSEQTAFNAPHDIAEVLRGWLAYNPEKVLFATDAYPGWRTGAV